MKQHELDGAIKHHTERFKWFVSEYERFRKERQYAWMNQAKVEAANHAAILAELRLIRLEQASV